MHLRRLDRLLTTGEPRVACLSSSVLMDIRKLHKRFVVFSELSRGTQTRPSREAPLLQIGETEVHLV
jgi:hypothetical protein